MRAFLLHKGSRSTDKSLSLLRRACDELGLESLLIDIETFDFTCSDNLPRRGDILYRIADGSLARTVEKFLLSDGVASFYKNTEQAYFFPDDLALYHRHGLPTPKTIPAINRNRDLLQKSASFVGGFPLILKILGKSHGVGILKVDSLDSLFSLVDILSQEKNDVVMKEFIPHQKHARLIVLGDTVIDSIAYISQGDDFRTNVGKNILVAQEKFSSEIEVLAVKAVSVSGWEFGGVDIIIDERTNKPYLAEVNFPCFFPRAEELTGTPIAKMMLEHLIQKATLFR